MGADVVALLSLEPAETGATRVMELPQWLHTTFAVSLAAVIGMVSVAMYQENARPLTFEQRLVPALGVVDRCEGCHDAETHPGDVLLQHPVEKFGCSPCHGGQGLATTRQAAHERSPDWERPLYSASEREAACGTCHLGETVEGAPVLSRGRAAIAERSCAGCHEIPGFAAPDYAPELDGLASKVTPGWVRAWLRDPGALNSVHRMPTFELPGDKREALIAFLFSVPGAALTPVPADAAGDSDRGRRAVSERRCATCHKIGERGGTTAADLGWAGAKLSPSWLYSYLLDTHGIRPRTRMPGFELPPAEAADIVAFAAEQWVPDTAEPAWAKDEAPVRAELAEAGRTAFIDLGCAGCHGVERAGDGRERAGDRSPRVSVSFGGFGSRRIADMPSATPAGTEPTALPDLPSWIALKITQPHAFDASAGIPASMPAFVGMEPDEALAIGVALTSLRATPPPGEYLVRPVGASSSLPAGETGRLVTRYRCLVCHTIGGEGGGLSRVPLDGEGARVRHDWLVGFLQSPVTIRMDQAERMPILGISAVEAGRLATWIQDSLGDDRIAEATVATGALLGDPQRGRQRFDDLGCPSCHVVAGQGTMAGPVLDNAGDRLAPDYVVAMLTVGPAVVPGGRHPPSTWPSSDAGDLAAFILALRAPAVD